MALAPPTKLYLIVRAPGCLPAVGMRYGSRTVADHYRELRQQLGKLERLTKVQESQQEQQGHTPPGQHSGNISGGGAG